LVRLRNKLRLKRYSIRTEEAYVDWVRRFIRFHEIRRPASMGTQEVEAVLTHLTVNLKVAASTQSQAKSAPLFLYREALGAKLASLSFLGTTKTPDIYRSC